jgi:exodeoxyribonuclease III
VRGDVTAVAPGDAAGGLTVSTVNVNGIRAAARKGFLEWLAGTPADVVCLQECRALPEEFPELPGRWRLDYVPGAAARGRNGVGVLTRAPSPEVSPPSRERAVHADLSRERAMHANQPAQPVRAAQAVRVGFGSAEFDDSGRYLEVDLPDVTVASLYLPKGVAGTAKQDAKDRFLAEFIPYLAERREKAAAEDREVLVCGDWNIAPTALDVRNYQANLKNSGVLPHERDWIAAVLAAGYVDVVRELHPGVPGPYTWWSYRGRAFDNDVGWRIDYQLATAGLARRAESAWVDRAEAHPLRWSDHAPVTVRYRWPGARQRV